MKNSKLLICVAFCAFALAALAIVMAQDTPKDATTAPANPDILLIYSSGNVPAEGQKADAVTCATPKNENVKTLATKLAAALTEKKISVRLVEATEVKDYKELLDAKMIVLASPAYFSNVSWSMKKMFDERLGPVYSIKEKLNKKPTASLVYAHAQQSADAATKIIADTITTCNGEMKASATLLLTQTPDERNAKIAELAEKIVAAIK